MHASRRTARGGFTLVELLVVIAIIALISAAALPTILTGLNERRVSEAARLLQAVLSGTRDAAIRANAPRGIRLLADPTLSGGSSGVLAMNRMIPIEPAPDYTEGLVTLSQSTVGSKNQIVAKEALYSDAANTIPSNPTSWYWNVRQGDKIRFNDAGNYYTIAGPMIVGPLSGSNSERYINHGQPAAITYPRATASAELLILVNGIDDDGDGFTDESFDGLDNDGDGIVDPAFNGLDDDGDGTVDNEFTFGEYEDEKFVGSLNTPLFGFVIQPTKYTYTITRRPVVSPGAREITLPAGVVIDLTTWNAATSTLLAKSHNPILQPERSRLPVDPYTNFVDIMIAPNGQVVQGGAGAANGDINALSPTSSQPFYHFWLTEREGVVPPLWGTYSKNINASNNSGSKDILSGMPNLNPSYGPGQQNFMLPMPKGTPNYTNATVLTGERRLVTLFVKTGQIVANSISDDKFNVLDTNAPFYDAQSGIKEPQ